MIVTNSSTDNCYKDPAFFPRINPSLNHNSNINNNNNTVVAGPVHNNTTYNNVDNNMNHHLNASLNPYTNTNTTTPPLSDNTTTNNNDVDVASIIYYHIDNNMNHYYVTSYDSTPYLLDHNPYTNTNTTLSDNTTTNVASTSYNVNNNMNYYHVASYNSTPHSLNASVNPHSNTNTTEIVNNTSNNNNVVRSEITSNVASTSYDVNNHNNSMMNLQWHSEFPPGFRFVPTDEELIIHYLHRRIMNLDLPHNKIKDVNLYEDSPDKISEKCELLGEYWYFFTSRDRKYGNGIRPNRAVGLVGYWKATGGETIICYPHTEQTIGSRRSLSFFKGKPCKGSNKAYNKTDWIMHEFKLRSPPPDPEQDNNKRKRLHQDDHDMQLDIVLCRIHQHKSSKGDSAIRIGNENQNTSHPQMDCID